MRSPEPRGPRRRLAALGVALAVPCSGCASLSTHQSTEPVPDGKWQFSGSVGGVLWRDTEQHLTVPGLPVELGARRGLGGDVDVGAKVYVQGVDAGVKWRFKKGDWPLAIAPALGLTRTRDTGVTSEGTYGWGHLPLIIGHSLSEATSVNFGPRVMLGVFYPRGGGRAAGVSPGGFVNLDVRMGEHWRFLPELSVHRSILGDVPVRGWSLYLGPAIVWEP